MPGRRRSPESGAFRRKKTSSAKSSTKETTSTTRFPPIFGSGAIANLIKPVPDVLRSNTYSTQADIADIVPETSGRSFGFRQSVEESL
jgi:hypothetical protein